MFGCAGELQGILFDSRFCWSCSVIVLNAFHLGNWCNKVPGILQYLLIGVLGMVI